MRDWLFATFVVICLLAVTAPGYAWLGAHIEPMTLGLPWSLVWNILWVALSFTALLVYHLTEPE
ncbi:MAG: hypothetical protein AAFN74_14665 [Myxococcota bacterium]